jgi:hypothetical protein
MAAVPLFATGAEIASSLRCPASLRPGPLPDGPLGKEVEDGHWRTNGRTEHLLNQWGAAVTVFTAAVKKAMAKNGGDAGQLMVCDVLGEFKEQCRGRFATLKAATASKISDESFNALFRHGAPGISPRRRLQG